MEWIYRYIIIRDVCVCVLDINECTENGKLCTNGNCQNTEGSYHCVCHQGFRLSPDRAYCLGRHQQPRIMTSSAGLSLAV